MGLKILIVEDVFIEADHLSIVLTKAGHTITGVARSVEQAFNALKKDRPDMVMLDIFLKGDLTGIHLAGTLTKNNIPFIYLSANSNPSTLEAAKATNPYGFLVKPFREKDILIALDIAAYRHRQTAEHLNRQERWLAAMLSGVIGEPGGFSAEHADLLRLIHGSLATVTENIRRDVAAVIPPAARPDEADRTHEVCLPGIIGRSPKLLHTLDLVRQVAAVSSTVLILGETGVGKEGLATAIHGLSERRDKPLIKINCAAIPDSLAESELFGHERGAFTDATTRRIGKFEQAQGGTVFLDEIGELPLSIQAKLLRVLQEKEIQRVGGALPIKIDVRVIAASNRDLHDEVAKGRFRMDLYYRIHVFPILVPPLRERREDISLLAEHFLLGFAGSCGKPVKVLSPGALQQLINYSWPGNIRELQHLLERHVIATTGDLIEAVDLPVDPLVERPHALATAESAESRSEKGAIMTALKACNGKVSGKGGAAELMGINPNTLSTRMRKLGIRWRFMLK